MMEDIQRVLSGLKKSVKSHDAGIDVNMFAAHSVRGASSSAAVMALKAADWTFLLSTLPVLLVFCLINGHCMNVVKNVHK